jgi:hypothetical protein
LSNAKHGTCALCRTVVTGFGGADWLRDLEQAAGDREFCPQLLIITLLSWHAGNPEPGAGSRQSITSQQVV